MLIEKAFTTKIEASDDGFMAGKIVIVLNGLFNDLIFTIIIDNLIGRKQTFNTTTANNLKNVFSFFCLHRNSLSNKNKRLKPNFALTKKEKLLKRAVIRQREV